MRLLAGLLLLLTVVTCPPARAHADASSQLAFVREYLRELELNERLRDDFQEEQQKAAGLSDLERMAASVHGYTKMQIELSSQIAMLNSMQLDPPIDKAIPAIVGLYQYKLEVYQKVVNILSVPIADANGMHEAMAAVAKLRAVYEAADQALLNATPMIAFVLLDLRPSPDPSAKVTFVITTTERDQLIQEIRTSFGDKLEAKHRSYMAGAAYGLLLVLSQGIKCADEQLP